MIVTNTPAIVDRPIEEYLGIVDGQCISGMGMIMYLLEQLRGTFGGRSRFHESKIVRTREIAYQEMVDKAQALDADAVVGFRYSYSMIAGGRLIFASASGTAVKLADQAE